MCRCILKWVVTISLIGALAFVVYSQFGQSSPTPVQVALSKLPDGGCLSCHRSRIEEEPSLEGG